MWILPKAIENKNTFGEICHFRHTHGSQANTLSICHASTGRQNFDHEPSGWWSSYPWTPKNCSSMLYDVINYGVNRKQVTLITILSKKSQIENLPNLSRWVLPLIPVQLILKE